MPDSMQFNEAEKKIIEFLNKTGPSIPIRIAKEVGISSLFTGAFLSELLRKNQIKISKVKIGNSPLYFLPGQEALLENFISYLSSRERDACSLLKQNKFLYDGEVTPVIRVALRSITDFAIPIRKNDRIYWRYYLEKGERKEETTDIPQEEKPAPELKKEEKPVLTTIPEQIDSLTPEKLKEEAEKEMDKEMIEEYKEQVEQINEKIRNQETEEKIREKQTTEEHKEETAKRPLKINPKEKFLHEVKNYLLEKGLQIISIEKYDKKQVIAKIKREDKDFLLSAYNKRRFDETDIVKIHKKYPDSELYLLSKGELSKKTIEFIEAAKKIKIAETIQK